MSKHPTWRVALAVLVAAVAALAPSVLTAQTQSTAPTTHAGTKLSFPASLGGATFERSVNYAAPPGNRPDQGFNYFYSTPKKMIISVQVFDGGRRVPSGSDNPTVIGQFASELSSAEQQFSAGGYSQFQRPSVASTCGYGAVTFRCTTYGGVSQNGARVFSKLLLTGFRDHFVKIRIDWILSAQQSATEADTALQAFVPALMR